MQCYDINVVVKCGYVKMTRFTVCWCVTLEAQSYYWIYIVNDHFYKIGICKDHLSRMSKELYFLVSTHLLLV